MEEYTNEMAIMDSEDIKAKDALKIEKYNVVKAKEAKKKKKKPEKHAKKLYLEKRRAHAAYKLAENWGIIKGQKVVEEAKAIVDLDDIEQKPEYMPVIDLIDMTTPEAKQKMEMDR